MSNKLLRNLTGITALAFTLFFCTNLSAATFTAIASGDWSASATWAGGTAPGTNITNDVIIIGAAFDVNLNQNVEINGALSSLQVDGELATSNSSNLTINQGTLLGAGEIMVDELTVGTLAIITYTGSIAANTFTSAAAAITLALDLTVNQTLNLTGGLVTIGTGAVLNLQNNSTIIVNGGSLATSGSGALGLSGNYNVVYNGSSTIAGLELSGSGLNNVTISLSNAAQGVGLTSDLTVNGMLSVQGGQLNLNGNDLTLNGGFNVSGSGSIAGSNGSDITLGGSTGGSLAFTTGSQTTNNFTINLPSSALVSLESDLTITGNFSNSSGTLNIQDVELTINGNITGGGSIMANSGSSLTLNGTASLTGDLNISTNGSTTGTIGNLTIDLNSTSSVMLGANLMVTNMLTLTSGSLALNNNELMITGNISSSGTGTITGGGASSVSIMTSGNVTGNLRFNTTGQGATLQDLTIDIDNNGSISLGSNVTINGTLSLDGGNLNLNGNTITTGAGAEIVLDGSASVMGIGNFSASAAYNLTLTGSGSTSIGVFGIGSTMGDLTIDMENGGTATVGSDLTVNGTLDLQGGTLDLDGYDLTINGDISGGVNGSIASNGNNTITINSSTTTTGGLNFSTTGQTVGSLNVNVQDGGSVSIMSALTVENELNLISGLVVMMDGNLNIATTGMITGGNADSYIVTAGQGSLQMEIGAGTSAMFALGTMSNFAPAHVTLNNNNSSMFSVRLAEGVMSNGTTGSNAADVQSVVNATWFVESDITAGLDMDLTVEWASSMEVNGFNRDSAYVSHYVNGAWDMDASASATAEASGRYSLTRTGITSLSPFAVFDDNATVGIREVAAVEDLNIFPNPAINVVNIPMDVKGQASTVKIIDLNGATVIEMNRDAFEAATIDVGALTNGMYLVKVIGNDYVSTGRFVKN